MNTVRGAIDREKGTYLVRRGWFFNRHWESISYEEWLDLYLCPGT